ncbi:hypothetical protein [Micromonospora sp. CPCC 206061]|uniref:hypothetical protein n=1 Tax=Micromonospora sp. CPCC 206061 TaxID=3122410 RepID=UPI002FF0B96F
MSTINPPDGLPTIAADDALLDALGQGSLPADADPVAEMLFAWRADLDPDAPDDITVVGRAAAGPGVAVDAPEAGAGSAATVVVLRPRRLARAVMGAAAGAILLTGLGVATYQSEPGGPLWPITEVVYPQQAEIRAAENAIALARAALAAGKHDAAARQLDEADAHVAKVDDEPAARRLRDDIGALRKQLGAASPSVLAPAPTPSTQPAPTVSPGTAGNPAAPPAPASPSPSPERSSQPGLLPLPSLLPNLPLPTLPPLLGD